MIQVGSAPGRSCCPASGCRRTRRRHPGSSAAGRRLRQRLPPAARKSRKEHARDGVRDRVRGQRLARHGRRLEQRQAGQRTRHPRCRGLDDPLAFDDQPGVRVRIPACRAPRHLDSHRPRLALDRSADPPPNAPPSPRGTPPLIDVKELEGRRTGGPPTAPLLLEVHLEGDQPAGRDAGEQVSPSFRAGRRRPAVAAGCWPGRT